MTSASLVLSLLACAQEYDIHAASKELYVPPLADAGGVTVGERITVHVPIYSMGRAGVSIDSITVVNEQDEEAFVLLESWPNLDTDEDGVEDVLEFEEGAADGTMFEEIEINFRPESEGYFRATVYVDSNDTTVTGIDPVDGVHDGGGVRVFQIRGLARYPRSSFFPRFIDFGQRAPGGAFFDDVSITNNGSVILTIAGFNFLDGSSSSYYVDTIAPVYILPGDTESIEVGYLPGKTTKERAELELVTNDPEEEPVVILIGNSCEDSVSETWDRDGDGYYACGSDCNDNNSSVYPDAQEVDNNIDDDCDGQIDEGADAVGWDNDGDGYSENEGDCNDEDPDVSPDASEVQNNQIDDDCDGKTDEWSNWRDDDGDGYADREGDCDDTDPELVPGATEIADGIDNDCDDNIDEGTWEFDDDQDGWTESEGDCDDYDAWSYPDALEDCDGIDNDCDNQADEGEDGAESACAYLAEQVEVTAPERGCSSVPGRGAAALGLLALLAFAVRRRD
jgi:hypothetical protein